MKVIPALDPLEHGQPRLGLGPKAPAVEQVALEGLEEALGHGVVVSITN